MALIQSMNDGNVGMVLTPHEAELLSIALEYVRFGSSSDADDSDQLQIANIKCRLDDAVGKAQEEHNYLGLPMVRRLKVDISYETMEIYFDRGNV